MIKTRKPGGGRKPLPPNTALEQVTIYLTHDIVEWLKANYTERGSSSRLIHRLLTHEKSKTS